jgi:AcrR family transcriptional regulator
MSLVAKSDPVSLVSEAAPADIGGDPQARTRFIIDAAYELLEEEGLAGLTIRAVLKRTGLSRRAFYERFEGKDDLMLAVFEQTIALASAHYAAQVKALADPMERLKLIVVCLVLGRSNLEDVENERSGRRSAALSREHLRLAEARPDDLHAAVSPLITLISDQLSQGMDAGVVRRDTPQMLAALIYNVVSTTTHMELLSHEKVAPDQARRIALADEIWEFCRRAIAA